MHGHNGWKGDPVTRFWKKVQRSEGCWEWTGSRLRSGGYGGFSIGRMRIRAHRYSWYLATGQEPPADLDVCHRCDNPPCVRPDHLFLGTRAENLSDMHSKGRGGHGLRPGPVPAHLVPRGERNGHSKMTADRVRAIRSMYANGATQESIAREFGLGQTGVSAIVRRVNWRHVD